MKLDHHQRLKAQTVTLCDDEDEGGSHLVVGVVAAAAELVPALRAAEVHAAAFGQSVLKPAVRTCCKRTTHTGKSVCRVSECKLWVSDCQSSKQAV